MSSVTVPSWRSGFLSRRVENVFMTYGICILRTLLSGWSFCSDICKLWSHCSHYKPTYMTIVELFDEYSAPFSPEVIRSLINKGMGPRLGNGISTCFFAFLRGGIRQAILNPFFFQRIFFASCSTGKVLRKSLWVFMNILTRTMNT